MTRALGDEPPHIGSSLDTIRAAIRMVADGLAQRVTVYTPAPAELLPAARILARAAGVAIESVDETDAESELEVAPAPLATA